MSCRGPPWFVVHSGHNAQAKPTAKGTGIQNPNIRIKPLGSPSKPAVQSGLALFGGRKGGRGREGSLFQMKLEIRGEESYQWREETFPPVVKLESHRVD